jgi:hypothetical protein
VTTIPFPDVDWLAKYVGQQVVVDLANHYLAIGTVIEVSRSHISLADADLHDHFEANSTKEVYIIETRKFGIRVNRKRVDLPRETVVAISRMDEIA